MIHFKMTTKENYASFIDSKTGIMVFVDSFDNQEFNVRIGDLNESKPVGIIKSENDEILNFNLKQIYQNNRLNTRNKTNELFRKS